MAGHLERCSPSLRVDQVSRRDPRYSSWPSSTNLRNRTLGEMRVKGLARPNGHEGRAESGSWMHSSILRAESMIDAKAVMSPTNKPVPLMEKQVKVLPLDDRRPSWLARRSGRPAPGWGPGRATVVGTCVAQWNREPVHKPRDSTRTTPVQWRVPGHWSRSNGWEGHVRSRDVRGSAA